jgi:hypothetical protein
MRFSVQRAQLGHVLEQRTLRILLSGRRRKTGISHLPLRLKAKGEQRPRLLTGTLCTTFPISRLGSFSTGSSAAAGGAVQEQLLPAAKKETWCLLLLLPDFVDFDFGSGLVQTR